MTTRRPFRLRALTNPSAARLAPSGPRPNALPLHNVRDRRPRTRGGDVLRRPIGLRQRQALSSQRNLIKSHRKDRSRRPICSTARQDLAAQDLGGARRDRTDDLMLAKHALSQLSYGPVSRPAGGQRPVVVGLGGLEPPTSRLSSARSNQLSYKPGRKKKSHARSGFQSRSRRKSSISLIRKRDEGGAIPQNAA